MRGGYIPHDDHRAEFALTTALVRVDARPDFPSSERFRHRVEKKNAPCRFFRDQNEGAPCSLGTLGPRELARRALKTPRSPSG